MAPFNAYSREWGERFGRIIEDEQIDDLGDEAWLPEDGNQRDRGDIPGAAATLCRSARSLLGVLDQAPSMAPHVPGSKQSTRLRGQARAGGANFVLGSAAGGRFEGRLRRRSAYPGFGGKRRLSLLGEAGSWDGRHCGGVRG